MSRFDGVTLAVSGRVNKQWYKLSNDRRLWKSICLKMGLMSNLIEEIQPLPEKGRKSFLKTTDWKSIFITHFTRLRREKLYERLISRQSSQLNDLLKISSSNLEFTKSKICERCKALNSPKSSYDSATSASSSFRGWNNNFASLVNIDRVYLRTADILQHTLTSDCYYSGPLGELLNSDAGSSTDSSVNFARSLPISIQKRTSNLAIKFDPKYVTDTTINTWN